MENTHDETKKNFIKWGIVYINLCLNHHVMHRLTIWIGYSMRSPCFHVGSVFTSVCSSALCNHEPNKLQMTYTEICLCTSCIFELPNTDKTSLVAIIKRMLYDFIVHWLWKAVKSWWMSRVPCYSAWKKCRVFWMGPLLGGFSCSMETFVGGTISSCVLLCVKRSTHQFSNNFKQMLIAFFSAQLDCSYKYIWFKAIWFCATVAVWSKFENFYVDQTNGETVYSIHTNTHTLIIVNVSHTEETTATLTLWKVCRRVYTNPECRTHILRSKCSIWCTIRMLLTMNEL